MSKKAWQNNRFNEKIWNEMPRSFSLCDGDGIIRWDNNGMSSRLIIFEWKNHGEHLSPTQKKTLKFLQSIIDWKKVDSESGVFIFEAVDDTMDIIDTYKFPNMEYKRLTFGEMYKWFCPNHRKFPMNESVNYYNRIENERNEFIQSQKLLTNVSNDFPTAEEDRLNRQVYWTEFPKEASK